MVVETQLGAEPEQEGQQGGSLEEPFVQEGSARQV